MIEAMILMAAMSHVDLWLESANEYVVIYAVADEPTEIIAVDTPENLTRRLQRSTQVLLQVEGPPDQVTGRLREMAGILRVEMKDGGGVLGRYVVETEKDCDLRRELAHVVCSSGWGLLELRPVDMSLEDIFIHLVTEEQDSMTVDRSPVTLNG